MPTSTNAVYKAAAQLWKPWLHKEALLTLSQGHNNLQTYTTSFKYAKFIIYCFQLRAQLLFFSSSIYLVVFVYL